MKLAGQIVCATIVFAMGLRVEFITNYFGPGNMMFGDVACYIFTVLWLVAITNAVNLIDGLDGLAAGTSAISALCIGYVAYIHGQYVPTLAMLAIAGAALGFLPCNLPPGEDIHGRRRIAAAGIRHSCIFHTGYGEECDDSHRCDTGAGAGTAYI